MIRRIARPLLGSIFVYTGYTGLTSDPGRKADTVAPLVEKATEALPDSAAVPTSARTWIRINSGVQLGGGLLLATGRAPRAASLALAGTLVPSTVTDHSFWEESDPERRRDQQLHFVKNLSLLGGLLIAGFDTEGKPGVTWRARKAAERASARVSALTPGGDDDSSTWHDRAQAAQEYGANAVEKAKPALIGVAEKVKPALSDAVDKVKPAVEDAVDRARPVFDDAVDRARPALSDAVDRARPALSDAVDRARPALNDAVDRARPALADASGHAAGLVDAAGGRLQALREEASSAVAERKRGRIA